MVRRKGHDEYGRVRRVDFAVRRLVRQVRRQVAPGRVDRRLDVAGRAVYIPVEVELQRDARSPPVTHRGHLRDARYASQLALQRGGHRCRHRLRVRAGQRGRHEDCREIDRRQGRDGQHVESHGPGQDKPYGQKRSGDGPSNKGRRDVHGLPDIFRIVLLAFDIFHTVLHTGAASPEAPGKPVEP